MAQGDIVGVGMVETGDGSHIRGAVIVQPDGTAVGGVSSPFLVSTVTRPGGTIVTGVLGSTGRNSGTTSFIGNYSASNLGGWAKVPTGKTWELVRVRARVTVSSGTLNWVGGWGASATGLINGILLRIATGVVEADGSGGTAVTTQINTFSLNGDAFTSNRNFGRMPGALLNGEGSTAFSFDYPLTSILGTPLILTAGQYLQALHRDNMVAATSNLAELLYTFTVIERDA